MKPYSESCERNQAPILKILQEALANQQRVLEIASGTGQHAAYFGRALPHLSWQTSELEQNHEGVLAWLDETKLPNVLPPIAIDASDAQWPIEIVDTVFNANTVHIISWPEVERMFAGIARVLSASGTCAYTDRLTMRESLPPKAMRVLMHGSNHATGTVAYEILKLLIGLPKNMACFY
jgi:hypothetical protein